jgi:predicted transcriptional regulator
LLDKPVEMVMGAPYPVLDSHVDSDQIRPLLTRDNAACLVRDEGELVGIVTRYDIVRALAT